MARNQKCCSTTPTTIKLHKQQMSHFLKYMTLQHRTNKR